MLLRVLSGVGGFVVNDKDEVLLVKERWSVYSVPKWHLPGGMADAGKFY